VETLLLDAAARDLLVETQAAEADVERALELAEPDGLIWPFVVTPARDLLERHPAELHRPRRPPEGRPRRAARSTPPRRQ
jgi:LuxR family maltose regulon positive regulatory protein